MSTQTSGYVGGMIGGPFGAFVGAIGGNMMGSIAMNKLSDRLTRSFFQLPKSEALENCFNFMDLPYDSSNSDINSKYRNLARFYHPDKNSGFEEEWQELQVCIGIIKASKNEY